MSKLIAGAGGDAIKRWELPTVDDGTRGRRGPTVAEIEQIQQRAHDEGFARGHAEGMAAARDKAQRLERVLLTLGQPLEDLDHQVEQELLLLCKVIARQLIRRELKADPAHIIGIVREAVTALPVATRNARIHLHPEDAVLVRDTLSLDQAERPWRIVEDPVLTRGDCRVITDTSQIDATIESRLTALVTSIAGGARDGDESPDE